MDPDKFLEEAIDRLWDVLKEKGVCPQCLALAEEVVRLRPNRRTSHKLAEDLKAGAYCDRTSSHPTPCLVKLGRIEVLGLRKLATEIKGGAYDCEL